MAWRGRRRWLLAWLWLLALPAGAAAADAAVWRYGMLAAYPPFQVWPEGGWPGGSDLELLQAAARASGAQLEPVRYTAFDSLLADLRAGRIDVASAMARTPEREPDLVFGPPYAEVEQVLVQRRRDAAVPMSADLGGRRVAVIPGYASAVQVARLFPQAPRVAVADVDAGLRALDEGRADLFIEALPVIAETLDRLHLSDLRLARRVVMGSGALHLAAGRAGAARLTRIADAVMALGPPARQRAVDRWSASAAMHAPVEPGLNDAEMAFLRGLAPLVVAVVDGQAPFSMAAADGTPQGLAVDVLAAALRQLGLPPPRWTLLPADAALKALRGGSADLALGLPEAASRSSGVTFAGPFIEHPLVLVARRDSGVWSLDQMAGLRLAMPALQVPQTLLGARYPRLLPVACSTVADCLDRVQKSEADAMTADIVSLATTMASGAWPRLQIVGTAGELRLERGVALAPDQRQLAPLLQRALDTTDASEMVAIKHRWLERPPPQQLLRMLVLQLAPWVLAAAALLLALWWWHSRGLRREVARTQAARHEAEQKAAVANRFVAFLAHEVRNSLHSVIAGVELLRGEKGVTPAVAEPLGQSARSTLALLNGLLDRERLAAGALTLDPGPARLSAVVRGVLQEMAPAARLAAVELVADAVPGADPLLQIDALRVQQVLRNLLSNAIKYAGPGRVRVMAANFGLPTSTGRCRVQIAVRDHGPGLDADRRATPFLPFQGSPGRPDSAGLGLVLSRDLARAMGGTLTLDAADGGGLLATLAFEAEALPEPAAVPRPVRRRVLLVEDAEVYAMVLQRALEDAGWDVVLAGHVAAARQRLVQGRFDLVLTDLYLPDGNARDVLAATHGQPHLLRVVMTADVDAQALTVAGADAVLAKSADVTLFVTRLLARLAAGQPG
jgi:signal transduction histidine kinase